MDDAHLFDEQSKLSRKKIKEILLRIPSLNQSERKAFLVEMAQHLDYGGVTKKEWLEAIKNVRKKYAISGTDYRALKEIM